MDFEEDLVFAIDGVDLDECYDKMPKDVFLNHIKHYARMTQSKLKSWEFICTGFKNETQTKVNKEYA